MTFERVPLAHALRTLTPIEFRLLTLLGLGACPRTRRIWTTPLRLAEEFEKSPPATEPGLIDATLSQLVARGHLTLYARSRGALRCYEVNIVAPRHVDAPPDNLPVGHDP